MKSVEHAVRKASWLLPEELPRYKRKVQERQKPAQDQRCWGMVSSVTGAGADPVHFTVRIVPYEDERERILSLIALLGERIDLQSGLFSSRATQTCACSLPLGDVQMCVSLPAGHRVAAHEMLRLEDLHHERLMMIR